MENPIAITELNDFIFCPASIYFHGLFGNTEKMMYQSEFQLNGTQAHKGVDNGGYSSSRNILRGIKHDITNSLLDIGYTVLFNFVEALLYIYGFDLYVGVLHREFYMRKSLVCDLVEPFRPIIDRKVKSMINLKQVSSEDFFDRNHQLVLKWESSPKVTTEFLKSILEYKADMFVYIQSYYRSFMKDTPEKMPVFLLTEGCMNDTAQL